MVPAYWEWQQPGALALKGWTVSVFERSLKVSGASIRNFGMIWPIWFSLRGKLYEWATYSKNALMDVAKSSNLWG
ncbi:MAG: hypothetical protein WDM78_05030 [Puia sp.]